MCVNIKTIVEEINMPHDIFLNYRDRLSGLHGTVILIAATQTYQVFYSLANDICAPQIEL